MITLFDQDEVIEDYIASELREQTQKTAKILYGKNMSVNDIAEAVGYSVKIVERWLGLRP
ncbi:MAG: hypothetical protein LUC60_01570 [Lachnospiraceae bacterium]|nr:hypothetical protein [Lachnospiraceae bacterium]